MMFTATVLDVLVASPSDTRQQREVIRSAIYEWNNYESNYTGVVLVPRMSETDTYPKLGQRPQGEINDQIVDSADIGVATIWTTLGSATGEYDSGTVEEVERLLAAGRPVLLYFCNMPGEIFDTDTSEVDRVKAYRETMKGRGLFDTYRSLDELKEKVRDALTRLVRQLQQEGRIHRGREGGTEPGIPSATPPGGGDSRSGAVPLSDARQGVVDALRGYLAKWRTVHRGLVEDYSVQKRLNLAREVESVLLESVRLLEENAPGAPEVEPLMTLATDAAGLARTRVTLDGGVSFRALTEGIGSLLDTLSAVIAPESAASA